MFRLNWLKKDDDLYARSKYTFKKIKKVPADIGRFYMHTHKQDTANPDRFCLNLKSYIIFS